MTPEQERMKKSPQETLLDRRMKDIEDNLRLMNHRPLITFSLKQERKERFEKTFSVPKQGLDSTSGNTPVETKNWILLHPEKVFAFLESEIAIAVKGERERCADVVKSNWELVGNHSNDFKNGWIQATAAAASKILIP